MRDESWRRRFAMEEQFGGAKPGRGHRALASLYKAGKVPGVITQNIDNLHQASGIAAEARGRAARQHDLRDLPRLRKALRIVVGEAESCRNAAVVRRIARSAAAISRPRPSRSARRCRRRRCGAPRNLTESCDLFLAIGSSLVVWPAAGFPLAAKRNGARLVIINRDATEFDDIADLVRA